MWGPVTECEKKKKKKKKKKLDLTEKPVNQLRFGRMSFPDRCDDRRDSVAAAAAALVFPGRNFELRPLSFT